MEYYETDKVELKEKINDALAKDIESFLNTDGGTIYIGIKDNGEIVGTENIDENFKKISDIITDQIEPDAIEFVTPEAFVEEGKILIRIKVSKGSAPIYCLKKYGMSANGCHIRVGTTCKSMSQEIIKYRYGQNANEKDPMIKTPTYYGSISFRLLKLYYSEKGYHLNELSFENNLKLRTFDNRYNLLAELLSDTNSFPFIFVKFKGKDKTAISERNDYGRESLLIVYEKLKNRLTAENICMSDTSVRPRKDTYLFDADAVNEVLINALVHNDYNDSQPLISMFDDRLEILSHGGLPSGMTKEQFFAGISKPRNEALMEVFTMLGIVEHTGHGIPVIISKYGKEVFDIQDSYINVVIPFNKEVLKNRPVSENSLPKDLPAGEMKVLIELIENNLSTAAQLSEKLNIPFRSVQRYISELKEKGYIERVGSNKNGYWKVTV